LTRLPRAYQNRIDDALDGRSSVKLLLKAMEKLVYREKDTEWRHEGLGIEKPQKKDEKKKDEKKRDEKTNYWKKKEKCSSGNSFTTKTQQSSEQPKSDKGCYKCGGQHDLVDCSKFKALPANERLRKAKDVFVHICFRCLKKHGRGQCELPPECPVMGKGCRYSHNELLHGAVAAKPEKEEVVATATDVTVLTGATGEQSLLLVKLYVHACDGNKKTICHLTAYLTAAV
jgi:hypothetical protein